ncbi:MAG: SRPBCC family protein [Solirubrobacteraceae bacterium]
MATVRAQQDVTGPAGAAEALWYDTERWPAFIDGFAHVAKLEGPWPDSGAKIVWDSTPNGRGRVVEQVVERVPGEGQTSAVEDPRLTGTQRVVCERLDGGVAVGLELEYTLKGASVVQPLVDLFFIRRALRDSLRRTLLRFSRELAADLELL